MTWLATIASTSPFVGLFGTVMGVVDAFHGLGTAGSGTLRAVAPGIAEALITTAAGLFVAVPAVVGYNQLVGADQDFCLGDRRFLQGAAELAGRDSGADGCGCGAMPHASMPGPEMPREAERGVYK